MLCYRDATISFRDLNSNHEAPAGLALLGDSLAPVPGT